MKIYTPILLLMAILATLVKEPALSQDPVQDQAAHTEDHATSHDDHAGLQQHKLAILTGYGFLSGALDEKGEKAPHIVPVFGAGYEYWLSHKWGVGTHNELELGSYSVELDH